VECAEKLTASGHGRWGDHRTDFALSTITRTWRARQGDGNRSLDAFRLTFWLDGGSPDRREFATASQRDAFLAASISQRETADLPAGALLLGCQSPVAAVIGDELAGVWFVMDYLQLQLQGGMATFYAWPTVRSGGDDLGFGQPGYRDALCSLIGQRVVDADVYLDEGVVLSFSQGELVVAPQQIRSAPYPEVIEIDRGSGIGAGDPPFD
jgi:hypothetical protein